MKTLSAPSPFLLAHLEAIVAASHRGPVVDLACGRGRHALLAAEAGARVIGIDRNPSFLSELADQARARDLALDCVRSDLETPHGIPVQAGACGAILVFCFLFRPLAEAIVAALRPGGLLLYETFTLAQAELPGGPSNPEFLLGPAELPTLFPALEIVEHWEGVTPGDRPVALARLAGRRPE